MNTALLAILHEIHRLLILEGNDFAWSSWADAKAAEDEMNDHIRRIESEDYSRLLDLKVLFAPTGPIQEVSISSGWSDEYLDLAERFDTEIKQISPFRIFYKNLRRLLRLYSQTTGGGDAPAR
jgi:hypothetical protein